MSKDMVVRSYFSGMGEAVADRTVNRRIFTNEQRKNIPVVLRLNESDPLFKVWKNAAELSEHTVEIDNNAPFLAKAPETRLENWGDVAERVARGNCGLTGEGRDRVPMQSLISKGALLMSGRHLQHTDGNLKNRPMEVVTNCSSSATTFLLFYLLLNGSGVGRAYDDEMMKVNWANDMPDVKILISENYPDRTKMRQVWSSEQMKMVEAPMIADHFESSEQHLAAYQSIKDNDLADVEIFKVPDSRGGWAKAIELLERMTYEKRSDALLVLDFSDVRPNGQPIRGMQNRPSSGPGPLMEAIHNMSKIKGSGYEPWEATMFMDHYAAECVLVGGARRAARMATKTWRDRNVFGFIGFKREYGLWTSNNSVTIDEEFRERCRRVARMVAPHIEGKDKTPELMVSKADHLNYLNLIDDTDLHAWSVLISIAESSYYDGTGEPGIINQDRLVANDEGIDEYIDGLFAGSKDFQLDDKTLPLMRDIAEQVMNMRYTMITNPCGEITLLMLGAYCVIADVVPFHTDDLDEAEAAFRMATRALIRTNSMDCMYAREVSRTNRIGVGITGFHEWAYDAFGYTWQDIINEEGSMPMWLVLSRFKRAIVDEAESYSKKLGLRVPHTNTTFKPAGTTSKLFGLTEGAHLPSMRWYLRWVQFRDDDALIEEYKAKGYPVRKLGKQYDGTTIVGFPTAPAICDLDGGEWVTTAAEATPEEQYQFLRLLEKYWIVGVAEDGVTPLDNTGNQISYTLKYNPETVDFSHFLESLIEGQFSIRCCSVMPQINDISYEYVPEESISKEEYSRLMRNINNASMKEEIDLVHVDCGSGGCPISFDEEYMSIEDKLK